MFCYQDKTKLTNETSEMFCWNNLYGKKSAFFDRSFVLHEKAAVTGSDCWKCEFSIDLANSTPNVLEGKKDL